MGRAANELGYLPRALLVRQLSRIACNIPHFLYLRYVSGIDYLVSQLHFECFQI